VLADGSAAGACSGLHGHVVEAELHRVRMKK
jgi:hypothetical protein